MRRLASQTRDDSYSSRRDYQELSKAGSVAFRGSTGEPNRLASVLVDDSPTDGMVAFGGFVYPSEPVQLVVGLKHGTESHESRVNLTSAWNRFGIAARVAAPAVATIEWSGPGTLSFWGLTGGTLVLPPSLAARGLDDSELARDHLMPETFYFVAEAPVELEIDDELSASFTMADGPQITLKKCSYCGRLLPLDPGRPGALSFHKHKAKRTGHQNECRACKKWRINDSLNQLRTVDQLHESSVITRERKVFLREPQILQELKDRTGAGLKSQIWERFDRRCFYCERKLRLEEVQLDHTRPLAYLWPIDKHATCLCADHNNQKSDKFPLDFYSAPQLRELSKITGLPLADLRARRLNESELTRIIADVPGFAREWGARHFAATARRIRELQPRVDLYALLLAASPADHALVLEEIEARPDPVVRSP